MKKRIYTLSISLLTLFFYMLLALGNSSVAHASPASASVERSSQGSLMARSGGGTYAFVRNEQLWVRLPGQNLVQATHFNYTSDDGHQMAVLWNQLSWFDGDRYIAFKLLATRGGFGGGGCGYIGNDGATSALFVLDTQTMQITEIKIPGEKIDKVDKNQQSGLWQYLFTEDSTHLLVWHFDDNKYGGLYRYNFTTGNLSLALPASKFPEVKRFNDSYFPMRYANGQLYYEAMNPVSNALYDRVIYSHSVAHPNTPSVKILDAGTHLFCDDKSGNPGQYREPGWDVSPDGQYLVVQKIVRNNQGQETSKIQLISLRNGMVTPLLSELSSDDLSHDLVLSWAPNSQLIAVEAPSVGKNGELLQEGTLYTTTLSGTPDGVTGYPYTTNFKYQLGHITWRSDSKDFFLSTFYEGKDDSTTNVYDFTVESGLSQTILNDATNFIWA